MLCLESLDEPGRVGVRRPWRVEGGRTSRRMLYLCAKTDKTNEEKGEKENARYNVKKKRKMVAGNVREREGRWVR